MVVQHPVPQQAQGGQPAPRPSVRPQNMRALGTQPAHPATDGLTLGQRGHRRCHTIGPSLVHDVAGQLPGLLAIPVRIGNHRGNHRIGSCRSR